MSKIFVDQVDPKTATTLTLGTSGDTVSIPTGVTLSGAGTITASAANLAASGAGGVTGTLPIANGGTGATTLAAAGLANTPSFYVKQASTQSIGNGSNTKVTLDSEVWDTDSAFASDKFTVPVGGAGKYLFEYSGYLVSMTTNGFFELTLYLNGATLRNSGNRVYMSTSLTSSVTQTSSVMVELADADYVELYVYQDNPDGGGGSRTLSNADYKAYLSGCRLIGV